MKIKSAVIAPKPTLIPFKYEMIVRWAIIANIGPGGAAKDMPYKVPNRKLVNISTNSNYWLEILIYFLIKNFKNQGVEIGITIF